MPPACEYADVEVEGGLGDAGILGWNDAEQADWYLNRTAGLAERIAGEDVLRSLLPKEPRSLLDLGCGDGRLAALVLASRPTIERAVIVDLSPPMLERANERFVDEPRVTVQQWDLAHSIAPLGTFDIVMSGFAIHHLENERKKSLFREVAGQLQPNGLFANLEVVTSATPELHAAFLKLIGRIADDPEDRLASIESQLVWMREAGMTQVDCLWRWRGFALLAGTVQ